MTGYNETAGDIRFGRIVGLSEDQQTVWIMPHDSASQHPWLQLKIGNRRRLCHRGIGEIPQTGKSKKHLRDVTDQVGFDGFVWRPIELLLPVEITILDEVAYEVRPNNTISLWGFYDDCIHAVAARTSRRYTITKTIVGGREKTVWKGTGSSFGRLYARVDMAGDFPFERTGTTLWHGWGRPRFQSDDAGFEFNRLSKARLLTLSPDTQEAIGGRAL